MKDGSLRAALPLAGLALLVGLAGFAVFALLRIEDRLIVQGQQLRSLGETTDRLLRQGPRPAAAGDATKSADVEPQPAKILHPDVPNFLKPRDKHWPRQGASLDGRLFRGWPSGDPKGFNSLIENAADTGELLDNYVAAAVADRNWNDPEAWHGDLATRIEITDDYKEFTLYLRPGLKWHTPPNLDLTSPKYAWLRGDHPVTAKDLAFTFAMIVNPQVENGALKSYYDQFAGAEAVDDLTLVVRWKKKQYLNVDFTLGVAPLPEFLYAHDESGAAVPKETVGLRLNRHFYNNKGVVGAGPYRMVSYEPGSRIRLARNDDYFADKPAIREIEYPIYTDPNKTLLMLKAHEVGVGNLTPGQYRDEIQQHMDAKEKPKGNPFFDGRITWQKVDMPVMRYIGWNGDKPLFRDKRVRRAMTLAFNRRQILDSVFVGLGTIATGPFLPKSPANDPDIAPLPFDLDAARKLLAEVGFSDTDGDGVIDKQLAPGDAKRTPFEFTLLLYGSSKEYSSLANILKEDLLKIGVKMNIDAAEWSLMQKRMEEKRFDAYTGAWGSSWDSDPYQIWHSSQADVPKGSNRIGFRNKEVDALIETLRVTFEPAERTRLYRKIHAILHEEQPYSFFLNQQSVVCTWKDVKDVEFAKVRPVINTLPWSVARGAN